MARYTKTIVDDKTISDLRILWHIVIDSSAEPYADGAAQYQDYVADGSLTHDEALRIVALQSEIIDQ